jgi:Dolichyl-phosphate-mannose-protein mannosyltransferase
LARRPIRPRAKPEPDAAPVAVEPSTPNSIPKRTLTLLVAGLLVAHYALAASSLLRENPTVDEVNHLPAGLSYWQTGSFRLYHHNPPLIKLVAAIPVWLSGGDLSEAYQSKKWRAESVEYPFFGLAFSLINAPRYFELFARARLVMPLFSLLAGGVIFAWSRRLFGDRGGLLSLVLWCLCPNVLAHARLVTSDVGATALGALATYLFWRYLHRPSWKNVAVAGLALGLAELSKFSMLLLYPLWPLMWLAFQAFRPDRALSAKTIARTMGQATAIVAISVAAINAGYLFEGTGRPLGSFRFVSRTLTRPGVTPGDSESRLTTVAWKHRVNRFRGTSMARIPAPLPAHYLLGFDDQKIESEGIPAGWSHPGVTDPEANSGYTVYLDGVLQRSGWRSYYALSFLYKTPEGTLLLMALALGVFVASRRSRAPWSDEVVLLILPLGFFVVMTFLTDINLGLRYVLPIFPYLFVFVGRIAPWADGLRSGRRAAWGIVLGSVALTGLSTLAIHPHYLAHFNRLSGGPDRDPPRLIDSNLDWGQDLVGLREWLRAHPDEGPVGLAYFGQIWPNLFDVHNDGFEWFLPPGRPDSILPMEYPPEQLKLLTGPVPRIVPGLYAVSASIRQGLSWRVYDPSRRMRGGGIWRAEDGAFDYFREATPFAAIGHSILLFRLTEADAARLEKERLKPARP